jgi:hypothetical protein
MAGPALPVNADSGARSLGGTATLRMDLGHSWLGQLFGNAFRTTSRENQFQSGGSGFINRFDTVNSMREFGLSLDGNLFELPGGTAKLALGAQTRREHFSSGRERSSGTRHQLPILPSHGGKSQNGFVLGLANAGCSPKERETNTREVRSPRSPTSWKKRRS